MNSPLSLFHCVAVRLLACLIFLGAAAVALPWPALADPPTSPVIDAADIDKALDAARKQMDAIRKGLPDLTDDAELQRRRGVALDIQAQASAIAERLNPVLTGVQARLTELGPLQEGAKEAPDVAEQRAALEKSRNNLDSQIKLARLLAVEATQTADQVTTARRGQFQARLGERRGSVVGAPFWNDVKNDFPRDTRRIASLRDELRAALTATPAGVWIGLALAMAAVITIWRLLTRLLVQLTASRVPAGRLRRSFHALAVVVLATVAPGVLAELVYVGLDWNGQLGDDTRALLQTVAGSVFFGGFAGGLAMALLEPRRPSWRLPAIPDAIAEKLHWVPTLVGPLLVVVTVLDRLPLALNASLSTTMLVNCLVALLLGGFVGVILTRVERLRRAAQRNSETGLVPPRPFWLATAVTLLWAALAVALVCMLVGYVAFGNFIAKQLVWAIIVLAAAYLLCVLVDDFFVAVVGSGGRPAAPDSRIEPRVRDQAAVLLSGVTRVFIGVVALALVLGQFGEGPLELLQRLEQLRSGFNVGEVHLRPGTLAQALLVLAAGLLGVRLLKRWLLDRFLPTTALDAGMQSSATTLFGYIGVVVAVALSLSALGIGLERVAWVASALSVGIGFGLQAVVQNFVSGLILLAERPVKVGDWVSLGGIEGDIRRINVRATEIQMGDRSTVIVPNSEFITKTVRNVTLANPLGLVQIKLPMPLSIDAEKARGVMLRAFQAHPDILESPAPNVFLDGIDAGNLTFNATGYVGSPRQAYGTRSALLFTILKALGEAGLSLGKPPTMLVTAPVATALAASNMAAHGDASE